MFVYIYASLFTFGTSREQRPHKKSVSNWNFSDSYIMTRKPAKATEQVRLTKDKRLLLGY